MNQIDLYCPFCREKLKISEVTDLHRRHVVEYKRTICLMCGRTIMTADLNEPVYQAELLQKARMETEIRKLCALTGKTVAFVEKFIAESKISVEDLKRLAEKIALGEWSFEDDS